MPSTLSRKKRWEIVFLSTHHLGPKLNPTQVAKVVHTSPKVVKFWLDRYQATGDVEELARSGRPPITTTKQDHIILATALNQPMASTFSMAEKVKQQGLSVSTTTLWRRLKAAGLSYHNVTKKPLLTALHCQNRLLWAKTNQHRDWSNILFTDEHTFKLFHHQQQAWQRPGHPCVVRTVKHPAKVHIWGSMSAQGFGHCHVFTSNLNAARLVKIYKHTLLPTAQKLFGSSNSSWVLQEDNDPKHTSRLAKAWKASKNITVLLWPAQSPDLNCIENVWAVLNANVAARKPKSVRQLKKTIKKE